MAHGWRAVFALDDGQMQALAAADEDSIWEIIDQRIWPPELHLEETWHALHFVLTGQTAPTQGPLGFLLGGGAMAPGGYDARLFAPPEVRDIAMRVRALPRDVVEARCRREALVVAQVERPAYWGYPLDGEDVVAVLRRDLERVRALLERTADTARGMLVMAVDASYWGD